MKPEILPDIAGEIHQSFDNNKIRQPRSNHASSLGHPCTRYGVHKRVDWKAKEPINSTLAMIFNGGKVIERYIAKDYLERAGYQIVEANRPIQDEKTGMLDKLQIGGELDFICKKGDFEFPVEVKSMRDYAWEKIDSIEDLLFSKKYWEKQYPGQLTLYMLGKEYEIGCFLIINKTTFAPKIIWVDLDYTYGEELLQRAETINKHIKNKTYPDRIKYDGDICGRCDFAHICLQDIKRKETNIITDPDVIEDLERREKLKKVKTEYDSLDKGLKKRFKGQEKLVAGDFLIMGKNIKKEAYSVEPSEYWKTNIQKLKGATK